VKVIIEERTPSHFVISLDGELDIATAPALMDTVTRLLSAHSVERLLVDLGEVRFLDSSGVRALLQARNAVEAGGAAFAVSRPTKFVSEVLRMAAVDHLLGVPAAARTEQSG
jgi:anti-sigma B factor antagonist